MRTHNTLLMLTCGLMAGCNNSSGLVDVPGNGPVAGPVEKSSCVQAGGVRTLYVSAAAAAGGDGTRAAPFNTLQALQQASLPGDTLVVLPAALDVPPLAGGIALKPDQCLLGDGPAVVTHQGARVTGAAALTALPRLANDSVLSHNGDVVRLADGSEVVNVVITSAARGGIYGLDVPGAFVHGNDVAGTNTSCTIGFTVEPFVAPTRGPYFGIPLTLPSGWAGILIDANTGIGALRVTDNYVHDTACGNGIDVRIRQTADYSAEISRNFVTQLKQGPGGQTNEFHLVHAITTQVTNTARLMAYSADNVQTFIGGPGADCEGLFMNLAGTGHGNWLIKRNVFEHGIGGFSCNGMEIVVSNGAAHGEMVIRNSTFVDNPGDMIQQDNLGMGSTIILELDHVVVRDTTERPGPAADQPLPFNLGDCILAGSTGTNNTTVLRVRDSDFSNCNNGLTMLSGVSATNGVGPDGLIDIEISNSRFHNNAAHNFAFGAITPLRELRVKVENSDFGIAGHSALALQLLDLGSVATSTIDFGGGALGSRGGNCFFGGTEVDALTERLAASLHGNWWGRAGGPETGKVSESTPGLFDIQASLTSAPSICSEIAK